MLAHANRERIPVVPYGAGSSLEGHVIPVAGGIVLDLSRLDRIVEVRAERPAGVRCRRACRAARSTLPPGTMVSSSPSTRARTRRSAAWRRRTRAVRRPSATAACAHRCSALEVVLADGTSDPARRPRRQVLRGLRPALALRRLGGNARRDHRADPAAVRDSRAHGRGARLVSRRRRGLSRGRDDDRVGDPRTRVELVDAATVAALNAYKYHGVRRGAEPLHRDLRHEVRRRERPRSDARDRGLGGMQRVRVRRPSRRRATSSGRRATTPRSRSQRCRRARLARDGRRACRSRSSPAAVEFARERAERAGRTRRSSGMSATATSTSR